MDTRTLSASRALTLLNVCASAYALAQTAHAISYRTASRTCAYTVASS